MTGSFHKGDEAEQTPFTKSLNILLNDLDALGWDQKPTMYEVHGEIDDDPEFRKIPIPPEAEANPREHLDSIVTAGNRTPPHVMGIVIATESWRARFWDEVNALKLPIVDEVLRAEFGPIVEDWPEERIQELNRNAFNQFVMTHVKNGGVWTLPEELRTESRSLMAAAKDGRVWLLTRDRDGETHKSSEIDPDTYAGEFPRLMRRLLGLCPNRGMNMPEGMPTT